MRRVISAPRGVDLDKAAKNIRYVGSPEHKATPSFAGSPRPRRDASICDSRFMTMQDELTQWLKQAFGCQAVSDFCEGTFPRYAWYKDGDTVYEARLTNRGAGEYKGYPLEPDEWPEGIESLYNS